MSKLKQFLRIMLLVSAVIIAPMIIVAMLADSTSLEKAHENRARTDIKSWEQVISIYYTDNDHYPKSLEELTVKGPAVEVPLMDKRALLDPWGQPYCYDPTKRDPKTEKALIWSNGKPGDNKPLTNW